MFLDKSELEYLETATHQVQVCAQASRLQLVSSSYPPASDREARPTVKPSAQFHSMVQP